jgi:hypothetical protein
MQWKSIEDQLPPINEVPVGHNRKYVLAIDAKDRMSVGYAYRYSTGELGWTFAKAIGIPTHWTELPPPPVRNS